MDPRSALFPYTTLFRSAPLDGGVVRGVPARVGVPMAMPLPRVAPAGPFVFQMVGAYALTPVTSAYRMPLSFCMRLFLSSVPSVKIPAIPQYPEVYPLLV